MELTDKNSTGNYSSFSFTKSKTSESQNPSNKPSFSSISIEWQPSGTVDFHLIAENENFEIFPNPAKDLVNIKGNEFKEFEIRTLSGKLILKGESPIVNISKISNGIYLLSVIHEKGITIKKLVKK
ncbi:MAG: T9SS type A sorting domain-containing protein [Mariniphaga sp.]|nr:T9SS type A sorting domain-containing protein [Mariniphaga sp.]